MPTLHDARLFGDFALAAPDGAPATPAGRKARALLAFLILCDGENVTRERLAALLWSERGNDQARASLRQTLYELRSLADGPTPLLVLDRTTARLAPARLDSDLAHLRRRPSPPDAGALAALLGERPRALLADLDGIDPAFDEWLAAERVRRADERRAAALAVADAALAQGDAEGAARLAQSLLAADGTDEAAACLGMTASHRLGDRDALRQTFARLDKALREGVGVTPSAETLALYRQLVASPPVHDPAPASGDIVAEPTLPPPTTSTPSPPPMPSAMPAAALPTRRLSVGVAASLMVGVVAIFAGIALWAVPHRIATAASTRPLLAVEPLRTPAGDAGAEALDAGLAAQLSRLFVGTDASVDVADPPTGAGSSPLVQGNADFVVSGEARSDAGILHANVRLRAGHEPAILWSTEFSRPAKELDAMREQLAAKVVAVTACALGSRHAAPERHDPETLRLLLAACDQWHADAQGAGRLLAQVVQREPGFARGWAMLAWSEANLAQELPSAQADPLARHAAEAASRALALDQTQGLAYAAQAVLLRGIGHWEERMALLDTARAADPGNGLVDALRSWQLATVGRTREAIADARLSVAADPFDPEALSWLAELLGFGGDTDESDGLLLRGWRRFPDHAGIALSRFRLAMFEGDPRLAQRLLADPGRGFYVGPKAVRAATTLIEAHVDPTPAHVNAAVQDILLDARNNPKIGLHAFQRLAFLDRADDAFAYAATLPPATADDETQDLLFANFMATTQADPRFMTLAARQGLATIWLHTGRWPDFCATAPRPYDCPTLARRAVGQ